MLSQMIETTYISNKHLNALDFRNTHTHTKYTSKYIKFKRLRKKKYAYIKPEPKFSVQRFTMAFKSPPMS